MGGVKRGTAAGTRERILDAATEHFRKQGLNGTSVREIAATADADPALVIRHFGPLGDRLVEKMEPPPT
ncbi:helix-turn-helix domain-containing protein [uncultured Curtobacterium sp.]|uniref:TetR/AcrR family transcriptional regulator n=1 Tax=uncultured Curtobacterium sp. TaxID=331964 RepID=UPI00338DFCEA